jgi:uncharacterized protein YutE (UPF0331/DUF86 family)
VAKNLKQQLLAEQIKIAFAAAQVLRESYERVGRIFAADPIELSSTEKESCEALTARFARLNDFLFQRLFRTIDEIELQNEGTGLDRLNRMEKRGLIASAALWRRLRELRNQIAHEYLIEKSDSVLSESLLHAPELLATTERLAKYARDKQYL